MTVMGYVVCECGAPVLDAVAWKTQGKCADCHRALFNQLVGVMEIVGRNMRVSVPSELPKSEAAQRRAAAKRKARKTPESRANEKLREAAKQAAFKRMRDLFPELFEVLVADERAKRGLKAWTLNAALTPGTVERTLRLLDEYSAERDTPADR